MLIFSSRRTDHDKELVSPDSIILFLRTMSDKPRPRPHNKLVPLRLLAPPLRSPSHSPPLRYAYASQLCISPQGAVIPLLS